MLLNVQWSDGCFNLRSTACFVLRISALPVFLFLLLLIKQSPCSAASNLQLSNISVSVVGEDNRFNRKLTKRLKKGNKFMRVGFCEDSLGLADSADLIVKVRDKRIDVVSAYNNSIVWYYEHPYFLWQIDIGIVDGFAEKFEEMFGENREYYGSVIQGKKNSADMQNSGTGKRVRQFFENGSSPPPKPVFTRGEIVMMLGLTAQGVEDSDARTVSTLLQTAIINCNLFRVVEREQLERILREKALDLALCGDSECAAMLGHMLNSNKVIIGSIGKLADIFHINIRAVNTATGEVVYADKVECESLNMGRYQPVDGKILRRYAF